MASAVRPEQSKHQIDLAVRLQTLWCGLMHSAPMWPIRGTYRCRTCGCTYPVPWAGRREVQPVALPIQRMRPVLVRDTYPTKDTEKHSKPVRELIGKTA